MKHYEARRYRERMGTTRFRSFVASHLETDLWIGVDPGSWSSKIPSFCDEKIRELRNMLDLYIESHPEFLASLAPLKDDPLAAPLLKDMIAASSKAGVGPMASIAGAFAQYLGASLGDEFGIEELVIENGGDIYLRIKEPLSMSIFAGASPLSEKVGVLVPQGSSPLGICTSSGTVGHSFSFGKADAVMIACSDVLLADSYATSFCNKVQTPDDIESVLCSISTCAEILSAVIVIGDKMGIRGQWELQLFE